MRLVLVGCCLPLLLLPACGEEDEPPTFMGGSSGKGGSSGRGGSSGSSGSSGKGGTSNEGGEAGVGASGAGSGGEAGSETVGAPIVRITSPAEVTDPNGEGVLSLGEVTVRCEVQGEIASNGVSIEMLHEDSDLNEEVTGQRVGSTDEFTAGFVIASIPNGALSFRCSAESSTDSDLVGSDEIQTLVDHGPTITVITPEIDGAYSLLGDVPFEFTVEAAPIAAGDDGAAVDEVRLIVEGVEIDDLEETEPGRYTTAINFADPVRFPDPPVGTVPVEIYATNTRNPAVEASRLYSFVIDGEGPEIAILEPGSGDVVGGEIVLQFSVSDPLAGVDEDSVVVTLNTTEYRYTAGDRWSRVNDVFTFRFDSTLLGGSQIQATVNITASDHAQNESREGATAVYYLDNVPPIVDLDPEWVREFQLDDEYCSRAFDPLGVSPGVGERVAAVTPELRTLVWEQTNTASGQTTLYYSGVDPTTVTVYLQPDPDVPLLIDTDGDRVCDELAVEDEVLGDLPRQVLVPIPPDGRSWYQDPAGGLDPTLDPQLNGCAYDPTDSEPEPLCDPASSDLTRVISQVLPGNNRPQASDSAIYGIGGLEDPACTGRQWEIQGLAPVEGWICLAARAVDFVGNIGISAALPLCFDDPARAGTPTCASNLDELPPSCTDTCTSPPRFTARIISVE